MLEPVLKMAPGQCKTEALILSPRRNTASSMGIIAFEVFHCPNAFLLIYYQVDKVKQMQDIIAFK